MTIVTERPDVRPAPLRTMVRVPLHLIEGTEVGADVATFHGLGDGREHLLIGMGDWRGAIERSATGGEAPLVRLHSECLTGDVLGSARCDCGPQLREAVERLSAAGGLLLYLRQEGRGIGLYAKLDAYALQDQGLDTYDANRALGHADDERDYTPAAQMLDAFGVTRVRLLTNNPDKADQLRRLGIDVTDQVPTGVHLTAANERYLQAKRARTDHTLNLERIPVPAALDTGRRAVSQRRASRGGRGRARAESRATPGIESCRCWAGGRGWW